MSRFSRQTDASVEEMNDDSTVPLEPEDLKILGEPTAEKNNDSLLHVDVRTLCKNLVLIDSDEEAKTQLLTAYPKLENFAARMLDKEIVRLLSTNAIKRDGHLAESQDPTGHA
ncbi:hypothetical protein QAD02_001316 [Eretmocerus hayati]|uniref:Uncharacterized protein n=1 Tax=Eretmocerus hayati TaxID=131215 RepID=A0ACC2NG41_9HYME|nr:hypothetical protein QAD02_001316 [Eretmocerus hayati]